MVEKNKTTSKAVFWTYRWIEGAKPVAFFGNPNVRTNVLYSLDEIKHILSRANSENIFIPVPRHVLQDALDAVEGELSLAA